jgi:hypothetical protein
LRGDGCSAVAAEAYLRKVGDQNCSA